MEDRTIAAGWPGDPETQPDAGMQSLRLLCIEMKDLQGRIELAEEGIKVTKAKLDDLRLKQIPQMMETLEVKTATFPGVGRVQLASDLYASTIPGQKEAAMRWLRDCGYGDMIQETYNAGSVKAVLRGLLKEGSPTPTTPEGEDIFSITPFTRASVVGKG